jgi:hypothetical protein
VKGASGVAQRRGCWRSVYRAAGQGTPKRKLARTFVSCNNARALNYLDAVCSYMEGKETSKAGVRVAFVADRHGPARKGPPCRSSDAASGAAAASRRASWARDAAAPTPQERAVVPATASRPARPAEGREGRGQQAVGCRRVERKAKASPARQDETIQAAGKLSTARPPPRTPPHPPSVWRSTSSSAAACSPGFGWVSKAGGASPPAARRSRRAGDRRPYRVQRAASCSLHITYQVRPCCSLYCCSRAKEPCPPASRRSPAHPGHRKARACDILAARDRSPRQPHDRVQAPRLSRAPSWHAPSSTEAWLRVGAVRAGRGTARPQFAGARRTSWSTARIADGLWRAHSHSTAPLGEWHCSSSAPTERGGGA